MTRHAILLMVLLMLPGCRDDEAADKAAEEAKIEREVSRRVVTERKELSERKPMLRTVRVVGFIVLTGGAVFGLMWLRHQRVSNPVGSRASNYQTPPPQANEHYPVPRGRVLDLRTPSPRNQPRRRHHETPHRP